MKIANIMSRDVHFIGPDMTLREAAKKMKKIDSGALPANSATHEVGTDLQRHRCWG